MEVFGNALELSKSSVSKAGTAVSPFLLWLMNLKLSPKCLQEIHLAEQHFITLPTFLG